MIAYAGRDLRASIMLLTIASYADPIEAQIVCGRLQAEGIDAHIADAQMALANWEWRQAIGGTKVRVPEAQFEAARALLADLENGKFSLDDVSAPVADRETLSSRVAYLLAFTLGLPLPWKRKSYEAHHQDDSPPDVPSDTISV